MLQSESVFIDVVSLDVFVGMFMMRAQQVAGVTVTCDRCAGLHRRAAGEKRNGRSV